MANMSYCAFENTAGDLRQIVNMLLDAYDNDMTLDAFIESRSSEFEGRAVRQVLELCQAIIDAATDLDDNAEWDEEQN